MYVAQSFRLRIRVLSATLSVLLVTLAADAAQARLPFRASEAFEVGEAKEVGRPFPVNDASSACNDQGRCLIIWHGHTGQRYSILDRGEEEPVATGYLGDGFTGRLNMSIVAADDQFIATWCDRAHTVWSQEFSTHDGLPMGGRTRISNASEAGATEDCRYPRVSWTGSKYLVAWTRVTESERTSRTRWVTMDGTPQADAVAPYDASSGHGVIDVDFDGEQIILLSEKPSDSDPDQQQFFTLSADPVDGTFDAAPRALPPTSTVREPAQACGTDGTCMYAWEEELDRETKIWAATLGADGQWASGPFEVFSLEEYRGTFYTFDSFFGRVRIFEHGSGFYVAVNGRTGYPDWVPDAFVRRVTASGVSGSPIALDLPDQQNTDVAGLAADGTGFRVLLEDKGEPLVSVVLADDGKLVEARMDRTFVPNHPFNSRLYPSSDGPLVAWTERSAKGAAVLATPLASTGEPVADIGAPVDITTPNFGESACSDNPVVPVGWRPFGGGIFTAELRRCDTDLEATPVITDSTPGHADIAPPPEFDKAYRLRTLHVTASSHVIVAHPGGERVTTETYDIAQARAVRDIGCLSEYCAVIQAYAPDDTRLRFTTFRPTMDADAFSPTTTEYALERTVFDDVRLGVAGSRIIASWREIPLDDDERWRLGEVKADGSVEILATYTDPKIKLITPPRERNGRRAMLAHYEGTHSRILEGIIRLDDRWKWLDDEPIEAVFAGERRKIHSFLMRPEGGFVVSFFKRDDPLRNERRVPLYVQVIAQPGEGGEDCDIDADCVAGVCKEGECEAVSSPDTGGADAGTASDADSSNIGMSGGNDQGGCSCRHANGSSSAGQWPLLASLLLLGMATRRR